MSFDESMLTKGQFRKLTALRKSLGNEIADSAFAKWLNTQVSNSTPKVDGVAVKLQDALSHLASDKTFRLGARGYVVKRAKGKGASGFVASKIS